jgi:hypothetical protein
MLTVMIKHNLTLPGPSCPNNNSTFTLQPEKLFQKTLCEFPCLMMMWNREIWTCFPPPPPHSHYYTSLTTLQTTDHEMFPYGGVSGAVRETADYNGDCWTANGRSDRLFYYSCRSHRDWKHQTSGATCKSKCTMQMLSGWGISIHLHHQHCPCATNALPARIISWSVDNTGDLVEGTCIAEVQCKYYQVIEELLPSHNTDNSAPNTPSVWTTADIVRQTSRTAKSTELKTRFET